MADLRNTIAHILEHKQNLADANEATIQQYVVLPILRALGWNDANLASMEIQPEYAVRGGSVDYALKVGQKLPLFIECKKWEEPLDRHEDQIITYAVKAGMPIVGLTNGKMWRFYFSWREGTSVSDRIFCETDIEDRESAISDLEKYLLKSNVTSGKAKLDAETALEGKAETSKSRPTDSEIDDVNVNNMIDNQSVTKQTTVPSKFSDEWTIERVKDSLPQELRIYYEKKYPKKRLRLFYRGVAGVWNLIENEEWGLNLPKFSKMLCGFWLTDKGVIGRIRRIFGILPEGRFPVYEIVGKDGELIGKARDSVPPRLFVRIAEEDAEQLEHQNLDLDECKFCGIQKDKSVDYVYYDIPENISNLLPVLEFAYRKHSGN